MYRVILRLHDIKKFQSSLKNYTGKMHLAHLFYLFNESPPSIIPLLLRYIYFLLYTLLSHNSSSRNISVIIYYSLWTLWYIFHYLKFYFQFCLYYYLKIKSISRKNRHKRIFIITQLATFYCYSATIFF